MASNYIVINSKFKPFSYEEMLKPVQMATEAHKDLEDKYSDLSVKAGVWEKLADNEKDRDAYNIYKTYSDDLENQVTQLAKYGLTPASRQGMMNMKTRYSNEITPIETAYAKREKMAEEQAKYTAQNDSMIYDFNAKDIGLGELIKNPSMMYTSRSGNAITERVRLAAKNLAREIREGKNSSRWKSILGGQYFESKIRRGFSSDEIIKALENSEEGSEILNRIVDDAVGATGIQDWGNEDALDKAYYYANLGLWDSIGDISFDKLDNKNYVSDAEKQKQAAAALDVLKKKGNLPINIFDLVSVNQEGQNALDVADDLERTLSRISFDTGNSTKLKGKVDLYFRDPDATRHVIGSTNPDGKFEIFNKNGDLNSLEQVLAQAPPNTSKWVLKKVKGWYNNNFNTIIENVPKNKEGKINIKNIEKAITDLREGSGSYTLGAINLGLNINDSQEVLRKIVSSLTNSNGETEIKKVSSFDKEGNVTTDGHIIKSDVFIKTNPENGNITVKGDPQFYITPNINTDGLFMKYKGDMYLIPKDRLGSIIRDTTYGMDIPALQEAIEKKKELIDTYGEDAYYSSEEGQYLEEAIDENGAALLRSSLNGLIGSIKKPTYDVVIGENKNP